jgi:hypothetical protein
MDLKGNWHYDAQTRQLQVALDQIQTQGLYRMPVQIGITMPPSATSPETGGSRGAQNRSAPTRIASMLIDKQHNVLTIPLEDAPTEVQVDPNLWVPLMQVVFEKQ